MDESTIEDLQNRSDSESEQILLAMAMSLSSSAPPRGDDAAAVEAGTSSAGAVAADSSATQKRPSRGWRDRPSRHDANAANASSERDECVDERGPRPKRTKKESKEDLDRVDDEKESELEEGDFDEEDFEEEENLEETDDEAGKGEEISESESDDDTELGRKRKAGASSGGKRKGNEREDDRAEEHKSGDGSHRLTFGCPVNYMLRKQAPPGRLVQALEDARYYLWRSLISLSGSGAAGSRAAGGSGAPPGTVVRQQGYEFVRVFDEEEGVFRYKVRGKPEGKEGECDRDRVTATGKKPSSSSSRVAAGGGVPGRVEDRNGRQPLGTVDRGPVSDPREDGRISTAQLREAVALTKLPLGEESMRRMIELVAVPTTSVTTTSSARTDCVAAPSATLTLISPAEPLPKDTAAVAAAAAAVRNAGTGDGAGSSSHQQHGGIDWPTFCKIFDDVQLKVEKNGRVW
eukprot:GHVU01173238.1.p1 GENE.GHVU01173238.1~~GHVU01173238.1.p1  ORF type:complete len:461 (+),score=87.90 GHVU01173238.1:250-1632(+)